ncbi:hypothetical protein OB919_15380 [Halobacteria archaeon AArc-curdl1]|uniref:Uncharacterized protein n=1 Tax=Natronosalvus hydrolyticus TaxID=2979988 RepID=A0AAP2Z9U8_9EURY|nr:hypothetical protein [Halobacteria archaeon AArc-curdl1]
MTELNRQQTGTYRRHLLGLIGAGTAALAGCSDADDDELLDDGTDDTDDDSDADGTTDESEPSDDETADDESDVEGSLPPYSSTLASMDDLSSTDYFYTAADLDTIVETLDDDPGDGEMPNDPLLVNPIATVSLGIYGLFNLGLSPVAEAQATAEQPAEHPTLLYLEGAYVLYGSYDRDLAAGELESAGYDQTGGGDDAGYIVFTDETSSEVIGVTDEAFIYSFGDDESRAESVVTTIARANTGDQSPKHDTDDVFETLLRESDETGITCGLYGNGETLSDLETDQVNEDDINFDFAPYEGATGVVQGLTVDGNRSNARATVTYETADDVDSERLEDRLGTEAGSVDIEIAENTATVAAAYETDVID